MSLIYHIVSRTDWQKDSDKPYRHASLEAEGFIHCSRSEQVAPVANLFYANERDLIVLGIERDKLTSQVQDDAIETGETFPHVYGPINRDAVVDILPLKKDEAGKWTFSAK